MKWYQTKKNVHSLDSEQRMVEENFFLCIIYQEKNSLSTINGRRWWTENFFLGIIYREKNSLSTIKKHIFVNRGRRENNFSIFQARDSNDFEIIRCFSKNSAHLSLWLWCASFLEKQLIYFKIILFYLLSKRTLYSPPNVTKARIKKISKIWSAKL